MMALHEQAGHWIDILLLQKHIHRLFVRMRAIFARPVLPCIFLVGTCKLQIWLSFHTSHSDMFLEAVKELCCS